MHPRIICLLLLVLLCLNFTDAWADPHKWRVSGTVINRQTDAFGTRSCPKEGLRLRFKSRWSNGQGCAVGFSGECPWGASWGASTTNAQGRFSEDSYRFTNMSRSRDILIQYRDVMNNTWRQLTIINNISGGTPHSSSGHSWSFNLGAIITTRFECPTQMTPGSGDSGSDGGGGPSANTPQVSSICGQMGPGGQMLRPDFVLLSAQVMHRIGQPGAPPERLSWRVVIRNNGQVDYRARGKCRTVVRAVFTIPELSKTRSYEINLPNIARNQAVTLTGSANLGELSDDSSVNYPVSISVDPANKVSETSENNNTLQGCYNLSSETYSNGACP
jgi:hypothetical protein